MLALEIVENVLKEKDFRKISKMVYSHCGINLHNGKKELVRSRLAKRLRALNIRSFSEYLKIIEKDNTGNEFSMMIDNLSTNLTSFFREKQHYIYLANVLLPELAKQKCGKDQRIRTWSAGCSSGEEPYSMAITLLDALSDKEIWDIKLLATDVSTRMIEKAQIGVYDAQRILPLSPSQKFKYLRSIRTIHNRGFEVKGFVKNLITFGYLNLMENFPFNGPIDFIFCRNVMIYFDKETQQELINKFYRVLSPGGVLFTGHSESLTGIDHNFKYVKPTIYQK